MKYLLFIIFLGSCSKSADFAKGGVKGKPPKDQPAPPDAYTIPALPRVEDQGREGSCIAISVCYLHSIYTGVRMSPEFLYNNTKIKGSCVYGTTIIGALGYLVKHGGVTWDAVPYSDTNGCDSISMPGTHKIPGYGKILSADTAGVKSLLRQNKAIVINFTLDSNLIAPAPGFIWQKYTPPYYGPHSGAIVGYDSGTFIVMGQYGTGWGEGGFFRVDKAALKSLTYDMYYIL